MSLETLKPKVAKLIEKAQSGGNTDELEAIIDNSGVLDSTEGTVEEKVEQLVDKAEWEKVVYAYFENTSSAKSKFAYFPYAKPPHTNFINATDFSGFIERSSIETIDYYINSQKGTNFSWAFHNTSKLKTMVGVNTSAATNVKSMFESSVIETIQEPFDFSKVTNAGNVFFRANALKEIRFVAETIKVSIAIQSSVLSAESIQSIIDGLATVETAQTLTLHADVKAKLTQTQLDTITGKNWNLA